MGFTDLHIFKSSEKISMDADEQVMFFVSHLEGPIKGNWKVIAPTPETRVLYFEMEDGLKPKMTKGYKKAHRDLALGKDKIKKK